MESKLQDKSKHGNTRRRRTRKTKKNKMTNCPGCGFQSDRVFNVIRHYERIHGPTKKLLRCCGRRYHTKGEFYQHFVDTHPELQKSSTVLSIYKMRSNVKMEEEPIRRRSSRRVQLEKNKNEVKMKKEIKDENRYFYFDEDAPLINYVKNENLVKKEEEPFKFDEFQDCYKLDENDCIEIEIFFKGDATSPIHSNIQREYLSNIDFEDFKIA